MGDLCILSLSLFELIHWFKKAVAFGNNDDDDNNLKSWYKSPKIGFI